MIRPDDDWRRQFAATHEIVQCDAEARALALAQPADARGQSLKCHALLCQRDPASEMVVVWKQFQHELVGTPQISGVSRQGDPAERPLPLAEQRSDVLRYETGNGERIRHTRVMRFGANVVAVIEGDRARSLEGK